MSQAAEALAKAHEELAQSTEWQSTTDSGKQPLGPVFPPQINLPLTLMED